MGAALSDFQDGFVQAVFSADVKPSPELAALMSQPGFSVYRNTIFKGCIDALQANYPTVARLVGEEWFRAAAALHAREQPPRVPMLLGYGEGFADFLDRFPPAANIPYLPDVARVDRCWTEAHAARDEDVLAPAALACLRPDELASARLVPHAAARWRWFADSPIYTIWSRNRAALDDESEVAWRGEGVLLTRGHHGAVQWIPVDSGGCVFLDGCAAGLGILAAVEAALEVDPDLDFTRLTSSLLAAGAFSRLQPGGDLQFIEKENG